MGRILRVPAGRFDRFDRWLYGYDFFIAHTWPNKHAPGWTGRHMQQDSTLLSRG